MPSSSVLLLVPALLLVVLAASSLSSAALVGLRGRTHVVSLPLTSHSRIGRARRTSPSTIALAGCEDTDFSASVTIGTGSAVQTFELVVDTGSSTLAVAGDECGCGTTSTYDTKTHVSNGATDTGVTVSSTYASGSTWEGIVYTDTVALGDYTLSGMAFAVITSQTKFFGTNCNGKTPPYNQGIIGMAYGKVAVSSGSTSTDSFPDKWEQVEEGTTAPASNSLIFSLVLCDTEGYMWLNGIDTSYYTSAPVYVPITVDEYYDINIKAMGFTNSTGSGAYVILGSTTSSFSSPIVDSGTTQLVVSSTIYDAMNTYLNSDSTFTGIFGSNFLQGQGCTSAPVGKTIADLNNELPWLRIDLDNSVSLVMPAISSYLQLTAAGGVTYICPGVGQVDGNTVLGWGVMNNYLVVFDRSTDVFSLGAIGWAPTSSCNTGSTAFVYNTSTLPVIASSSSSGSNGGSGSGKLPFNKTIVIGAIVGGIVLLLVIFCIWGFCNRPKRKILRVRTVAPVIVPQYEMGPVREPPPPYAEVDPARLRQPMYVV